MRILISGAAGFLGSHLWQELKTIGHDVFGFDNMLGGDEQNIIDRRNFAYADCCDPETIEPILSQQFDVVYHCAAAPHEGLSVFSPVVVTKNTYMSTVVLAAAAVRHKVKRFVFTSSMSRYGYGQQVDYSLHPSRESEPFQPFDEEMTPAPVDPYGVAKVASEQLLTCLGKAHGMEVVTLVPHNIVGERQKYDDPFRNVASIMANLMLQGRQPIIYGDGGQRRCFSYVGDCVEPMVRAGFQEGLDGEVINIGPDDRPITINMLAKTLAVSTAFTHVLEPVYFPDRPCEVKMAWPSSAKARRLFGYENKMPLDGALWKVVQWIKKCGPKLFCYHLPIEILNDRTPKTWAERLF